MNKVKQFKEITNQMVELYELKNKNYGDSFTKSFEKYGLMMAEIRLSDKINRAKSIVSQGSKANSADESLIDTLMDLANYSIMTIIEINNNVTQKQVEDFKNFIEEKMEELNQKGKEC